MPELPELDVTRERLEAALAGHVLVEARLHDPFVLRTVDPPWESVEGRPVAQVLRQAKYLVLRFGAPAADARSATSGSVDLAIHLMLAGRLRLRDPASFKPHRRRTLCSLRFEADTDSTLLEMTEAGTKRRASLHVLGPDSARHKLERGMEPLDPALSAEALHDLLRRQNQHVVRALRDPELLAGIGNAYADEILFAARISPVRLTSRLEADEVARLLEAIRSVLTDWTDRVREACPEGLPTRQADWRLLADRRLSRLGIRRPPPRPK